MKSSKAQNFISAAKLGAFFFCLAGFIPLFVKLPYMFNAWSHSPLDRFDFIFLFLFFVFLFLALFKIISRIQPRHDWASLSIMLPCLLLYGISFIYRINALGIISAIVFAWAAFGFSLGWPSALLVAPAFGTLLMATTSSRYWLTFFFTPLQIDGLYIKFAFTALCAIFLLLQLHREVNIKPGTFCFLAMLLPASLLLLYGQNSQTAFPPFQPDFEKLRSGDFIGKPVPISDLDRRFFEDAILYKYYFASENQAFNVLNVICSNNIQKIHPASHCLRSSGWKIRQEARQQIHFQDKEIFLTEIIADNQLQRIMSWVWYSSQYRSVSSFIRFRSLYPSWKEDEVWQEYQITTPIAGDENITRKTLDDFIKKM